MLDVSQDQETLLEVNNIEVIYNHVILVLKGVSLRVPKGGITALLGGNGAGKSTTLKSISNLLQSERGEVTKGMVSYRGERVDQTDPCRNGAPWGCSSDGGTSLLRTPYRRRKFNDRSIYANRWTRCNRRR
jgi:ABC-type glutathione transport system ATPase component